MKKNIQSTIITVLIIFGFTNTTLLFAQTPDPPAEHGSSTNQLSGNGAPIGGELFLLLTLAGAYGGKKLYNSRKEHLQE